MMSIIIFYISLIGIVTMIALKRREVLSGEKITLTSFGISVDSGLHKFFARISGLAKYWNRKTLVAIFHLMAYHILLRVRNIYVDIKHRTLQNPHGKRLIDAVRGRGEVRNHGASFYLRKISSK